MKTYLFDTINRYKRFSEKLDVQTVICNKSWWVFNDSGEKELYIFNEDGTLDVSFGGRVTEGKWRYVSANKSIIVSSKYPVNNFSVLPSISASTTIAGIRPLSSK